MCYTATGRRVRWEEDRRCNTAGLFVHTHLLLSMQCKQGTMHIAL